MSGTLVFVIIIVAIVTVGKIVKQGMEMESRKHARSSGDTDALERENAMLRGKVSKLEERTAVLERIATDAPTRLTAEIEKLRD